MDGLIDSEGGSVEFATLVAAPKVRWLGGVRGRGCGRVERQRGSSADFTTLVCVPQRGRRRLQPVLHSAGLNVGRGPRSSTVPSDTRVTVTPPASTSTLMFPFATPVVVGRDGRCGSTPQWSPSAPTIPSVTLAVPGAAMRTRMLLAQWGVRSTVGVVAAAAAPI